MKSHRITAFAHNETRISTPPPSTNPLCRPFSCPLLMVAPPLRVLPRQIFDTVSMEVGFHKTGLVDVTKKQSMSSLATAFPLSHLSALPSVWSGVSQEDRLMSHKKACKLCGDPYCPHCPVYVFPSFTFSLPSLLPGTGPRIPTAAASWPTSCLLENWASGFLGVE